MRGFKNDRHARFHWGNVYDSIPKSVFATVAWHLANVASDSADTPGEAERRFFDEWSTLHDNGIVDHSPPKQRKG
jgi:hypothetical protein